MKIDTGDNAQTQMIVDPLEFQNKLIEPEGTKFFNEITRDLQLSNLGKEEVEEIRTKYHLIKHLQILEENGRINDGLTQHFLSTPYLIAITANSKNGFLRRRLNENVITQNLKKEEEKTKAFPNLMKKNDFGGSNW